MQRKIDVRWPLILVLLMVLSLTVAVAARGGVPQAIAASQENVSLQDPDAAAADLANCRYGATPLDTDISDAQVAVLPRLGAGWFLTFNPRPPETVPANDAEFVHMIHVNQLKTDDGTYLPGYSTRPELDDRLARMIERDPGAVWVVGNEVDRGPNPGEIHNGKGDTYPEVYALAYHDVYNFIKGVDPTARVAISALVEVTPGRLQYLDKMWNTYQQTYGMPMPVDIWTMHLYILPEVEPDGITPNVIANVALGTDPALGKRGSGGNAALCPDDSVYCFAEHDDMDIFAEQVVAMRQWMQEHGQRNRPLVITEFSVLYPFDDDGATCFIQDEFGNCFTPQRVSSFMENTFDYLDNAKDPQLGYPLDNNRLVQQWMWFSVYYSREGRASNLVEADLSTLTQVGQTFRNHVQDVPTNVNLLVDKADNEIALVDDGSTATAIITASFRNNGNTAVGQPFTVTFYRDAARTQVIDSVVVDPLIRGCATRAYTVSAEWAGLPEGLHQYWVHIDSGNAIAEGPGGEEDNIGTAKVLVLSDHIMLPIVKS